MIRTSRTYGHVLTDALRDLGTSTRIVDVREPDEFDGELGHIAGSLLVPLDGLAEAARDWDRQQPICSSVSAGLDRSTRRRCWPLWGSSKSARSSAGCSRTATPDFRSRRRSLQTRPRHRNLAKTSLLGRAWPGFEATTLRIARGARARQILEPSTPVGGSYRSHGHPHSFSGAHMTRYAVLSVGLALAAIGCKSAEARNVSVEGPEVLVAAFTVQKQPVESLYRTSGTLRGRNTAVLTSKTIGYVRAVNVKAGDQITRGQVLAVLEANDIEASAARARAGVEQAREARAEAEEGLRAAEAGAELATSTRDRMAKLHAAQAVPTQAFEDAEARERTAEAQKHMAEARLRSASARIEQAGAELGETHAMLDYTRITSPFAGRVIERRTDPGNLASPGMPLLVVEQVGTLRVEASVEESRAGSIALGDIATVEVEGVGAPLSASVGEIVPNIDTGSRAFIAKLDLTEPRADLRPGMFARVSFRAGTQDRLVVPSSAITRVGALERVFAVDAGRARLRMVTTGAVAGAWTEILSGLEPGEKVVQAPTPALRDGARVTEKP